jgi:tetratricopeptide (TPR) repeat protein/tRNA A-37 threonylcarbamoyl transferase component Bud32
MVVRTVSHYKILEKLGEGSTGAVYKAQDLERKRVVALKFLPKSKLGDEHERARFVHEARAAAALDHPNICAVHEIVETDEHVVVVMWYVAGRTIRSLIKSGPLELSAAIDFAVQIAEGLKAAHAQQIVHRDVKSANVMVTNVGGAKITDFGLGRLQDRSRPAQSEATAATAYVSPEQIEGGDVDQQSDVWALGVVLYEMLAGALPFHGGTGRAMAHAILNEEPAPLSTIRPEVPASVETIVSKALAKDWNQRYHSADAMLADLRKLQNALRTGADLPVRSDSAEEKPPKSPARIVPTRIVPSRMVPSRWIKSRVTWVVAAVVVVVIAGIIVLTRAPAVPFADRGWVLVADFGNFAGENVFDRSLDVALTVSLEQSRYVNVIPRRRAKDALRRMKKPDVDRIDGNTAREIAVLEGVRVTVVPTIVKIGDVYRLEAKIQDSETGKDLRTEVVEAGAQPEVLAALDELARRIRRHLGENRRAISRNGKPLDEITTSSLAGLQQYAMGLDRHEQGVFEEAKRHYEYAVRGDSAFAIALGALGTLEILHSDRPSGIHHLNQALRYADETTKLEGYAIRATHAIAVEEDYEKAAQIYEMSVSEYPDASTHRNNLGTVYSYLGRHREAADQYREAIRAEPTMMVAYNGLVTEYLENLGRVDSALVWLHRQMRYEPQSSWPYYNLAYAYIGADSLDQAVGALERSIQVDREFAEGLELLGHVRRLQGRYEESLNAFRRLLAAAPESIDPHYYIGVVYQLAGDRGRARDSYDRFRQITQWRLEDDPENAERLIELGIVLTRMGQPNGARAAAEKAAGIDPNAHFGFARLYSVQGNTDESLRQLGQAIDAGFRDLIVVKYHPDFESLRGDPRLAQLLGRHLTL